MKKLILIPLILLLLNACDEKEVRLYPSFQNSVVYTLDSQGSFDLEESISSVEILDAVNDLDLDESDMIEDITTEGIWIVIKKLDGNVAESAQMDVSIGVDGISMGLLLDDYKFNIPADTETFYVSSSLIKLGVKALSSQFRDIIINRISDGDVDIRIEGFTVPSGSKLNIEIEIFVKQGLVIKQTI